MYLEPMFQYNEPQLDRVSEIHERGLVRSPANKGRVVREGGRVKRIAASNTKNRNVFSFLALCWLPLFL